MSLFKSLACCALVACAAGCATSKYSSPGALNGVKVKGTDRPPSQVVSLHTSGYYVLWELPLCSGDVRWSEQKKDIEGGVSLFSDHVSIDELQYALVKIAESRNCDLVDVNFNDSDTSYATPSYAGIIGALFGSSEMAVSAVLVPRAAKEGSK